jgi:hypothetical protein
MFSKRLATVIAVLGIGTWLAAGSPGRTQNPQDPSTQPAQDPNVQPAQEGMEVLTRGPVHEAFAEPVNYNPEPTKIVPKQPPDPIEELPPDQRPADENAQWIPGYWAWDDDRSDFLWVSGIWRVSPPGRVWVPGYWSQVETGWQSTAGYWKVVEQNQVQYVPQPPAPLEAAPSTPAPAADSVMVPGNWVYSGTRFVWSPPYWVDYRPGWVWMPAHYVWTPAGFVFVPGYWDLELVRRGLLFSPVFFTRPLWTQPSWVYRPYYPVYDSFLVGALFVRPGWNQYYFGDFFEARYRTLGFTPWIDFRFGRYGYDPLFNYYRWQNRRDRAWLTDLRSVYEGRFRGDIPRPPRTLVEQNRIVQNITVNNRTTINNINITNFVRATAPLNRFESKSVALRPVPRNQLAEITNYSREVRTLGRERSQIESSLIKTGGAATTNRAAARVVKFEVPKTLAATATATTVQPPPAPRGAPAAVVGGVEAGRPGGSPRPGVAAETGRKMEDTRTLPKTGVVPETGRKVEDTRVRPGVEPRPETRVNPGRSVTPTPARPDTRTETRPTVPERRIETPKQGPVDKRVPNQVVPERRGENPPERRYEPAPRRVEPPKSVPERRIEPQPRPAPQQPKQPPAKDKDKKDG